MEKKKSAATQEYKKNKNEVFLYATDCNKPELHCLSWCNQIWTEKKE